MSAPEKEEIRKRVRILRDDMKRNGIDMMLMTATDPHASEYVNDYFKAAEYFTGCTSDNIVFIVEEESARLWTDGRYFISAAEELNDTGIALMKMDQPNVPDFAAYLRAHLTKGMTLGFDGRCVRASMSKVLRKIAEMNGAEIMSSYAPADTLWVGRPKLPNYVLWILKEELCGASFQEKLQKVRVRMDELNAKYHVISRLDDIMWLLNVRGGDVPCNPVALSYILIGPETVDLFIRKEELSSESEQYFRAQRIKVHDYDEMFPYIRDYHFEGPVLLDGNESCDAIVSLLSEKTTVIDKENPTMRIKAVKNPVEIEQIRRVYKEDSVAVCRFICSMKKKAGREPVTEFTAACEMDGLRRKIPGFLDLSFPTISAWGPNAAMAHYSMTEESCSEVRPEGFLLVDSGGQYMGGTTDVTRTIAMGPLTPEMKRDFTLVAMANLRLLDTKFPEGTPGVQLDMIARECLYRYGLNYNHGTGHGIGYILNVHEGPHSISRSVKGGGTVSIEPGMIMSDEPGLYKEERYGIRTESILLCIQDEKTEFGQFLRFVPLTFVPIDLDAIEPSFMEPSDRERLNRYHSLVRAVISPFLEGEELDWLNEATREI